MFPHGISNLEKAECVIGLQQEGDLLKFSQFQEQ